MNDKDRRQQRLIELYRKNTGREPVARFPDDPDWEYEGSREEREALKQRIDALEDERVMRGQGVLDLDAD